MAEEARTNMREQIAAAMCAKFRFGSMQECRILTDAALDALLSDPGQDVTAAVVTPCDDRTPALDMFHAMIRAIKEGK